MELKVSIALFIVIFLFLLIAPLMELKVELYRKGDTIYNLLIAPLMELKGSQQHGS